MNTDQLHDSNKFELGYNANPQEIRSIASNFNKFLEELSTVVEPFGSGIVGPPIDE
jgi:hypothetical protein